MRHFHAHDAAYIEALTGQSWLAAEMEDSSHLLKVPLPFLERLRQDAYIRRLAGHCLIRKRLRGTM